VDLAAYSSELAARLDADGGGVALVEGTVCFVDVSGFTRLNERLGQTGPEGTEVVKQAVSAVFDGLITAAAAHGGDVLTFAGDAVSVLFTGDAHARRGAAAAAGMQRFVRAMPAVPTTLGPVRLQMSAGVESGTDAHLLVGGARKLGEIVLRLRKTGEIGRQDRENGRCLGAHIREPAGFTGHRHFDRPLHRQLPKSRRARPRPCPP